MRFKRRSITPLQNSAFTVFPSGMKFLCSMPLLTYSMVQSPSWEANWSAASQEIPRISRNLKVHYRTHKRPPPVSILGQLNPVPIHTSHFLEIHPNIIRPSAPRSPQWSPSLRFPHQDPVHPLSSPIRATCPAHLILLYFITRTILGEEYKPFSSSLCNLLHYPVSSSLLGPNILLNTMFSNTLSFLSSRSVNDQVSHPYKTTGNIIVLYTSDYKTPVGIFKNVQPFVKFKQDRQCAYNVILRRIRATIVAVEKQWASHIQSAYICSLR